MKMKSLSKLGFMVSAGVVVWALSTAVAQNKKEPVFVDSGKVQFKEAAPGVTKAILWGDPDVGPYGAFTKFEPGVTNAMHTHNNDVRIVVIRGAYIFKSQGGEARRVGAGSYLLLPGGVVHESSGDPKEGALFYEESPGRFDLHFVGQK